MLQPYIESAIALFDIYVNIFKNKNKDVVISTRRYCFYRRLFVCLFVCQQLYAKSYERISIKFSGTVGGGTRNNPLDF